MPQAVTVRKLAVQVADISDFGVASGVSKLLAGVGISVSPASGIGTVTVTNAGVTSLIAGTGITLVPASGLGDVTVSFSTVFGDGRYIKRSPSGETQTILPTTDNVPLTIKGAPAAVSDVLDIFDAVSPAQNLVYQFRSTGELRVQLFSSNASPNIFRFIQGLTVDQTFMSRGATGTVSLGSSGDLPAINWQVFGDSFIFSTTFVKVNTLKALNADTTFDASTVTSLVIGVSTRLMQLQANNIQNLNNAQFLSFRLENLTVDPAPANIGRMFERTDLKQVSWDDGTAIHRLIDTSPSGVSQKILPLTDNVPLTIQGFAGGTSDLFDINSDTASEPPPAWVTVDITSKRTTAATKIVLSFAGTLDVNGKNGATLTGMNFSPNMTNTGAAITLGTLQPINVAPVLLTPTNASTLGFARSVINAVAVNSGWTVANRTALAVGSGTPVGTVTNDIGLDITAPTGGTTNIGLRQSNTAGGLSNRLAAPTRIGDIAAPTAGSTLDVTGQILSRTKPVLVRENIDETQASITVPNVDTNIKTYTLPANSYTSVIAEAEGYLSEGALSTDQDVNIKVKFAGTQQGVTMVVRPGFVPAASAKTPFVAKASGAFAAGGTIAITGGAAAADANSTIFVNSLRIYGVV